MGPAEKRPPRKTKEKRTRVGSVELSADEEQAVARAFLKQLTPQQRHAIVERLLINRLKGRKWTRAWQKRHPEKMRGYRKAYREKIAFDAEALQQARRERRKAQSKEERETEAILMERKLGEAGEIAAQHGMTSVERGKLEREARKFVRDGRASKWPDEGKILGEILAERPREERRQRVRRHKKSQKRIRRRRQRQESERRQPEGGAEDE